MLEDIKDNKFYVGFKESKRAIEQDDVKLAFIANDTDTHIKEPVLNMCKDKNIPVIFAQSKKELGKACGVAIGTAVCVILK